jgi:hypothetical protein
MSSTDSDELGKVVDMPVERVVGMGRNMHWPDVPRQRCQEHYLGNLAEPVLKVDEKLQAWMRNDLEGLPAVPDKAEMPAVEKGGGSEPPPSVSPF